MPSAFSLAWLNVSKRIVKALPFLLAEGIILGMMCVMQYFAGQQLVKTILLSLLILGGTSAVHAASMRQAVHSAVTEHPTGKAQRASQRALAHEVEASRRAYLPQVQLFGDIGKERVSNPTSLSVSDNDSWKLTREIGVSASLILFDGYERANQLYRSSAQLDGAIYRLLATSETLALNAVEAYIDVVRHRQLLSIARGNIRRHREILAQIGARVQGGKAPASDRTQIEERVYAARAVEVEIKKAYVDAVSKYRKVIGKEPGRKMSIPPIRNLPKSVHSVVSASIANNYELKAASKTIRESKYAAAINRATNAPKVSLEGRASYGEDRSGSRGAENDLYVGLKLSWKLYDAGITDAREEALIERTNEAHFKRDAKVRDIREIAEKSWNSFQNGRKRASLLSAQVKSNRTIVRSYIEEYELAKRSLLDVLDAEKALFNSRFQQISISAGYRFSSFRMMATMSKLASYFGIAASSIAAAPDIEEQMVSTSRPIDFFNINIEPLK